jgi:hypothetical protein
MYIECTCYYRGYEDTVVIVTIIISYFAWERVILTANKREREGSGSSRSLAQAAGRRGIMMPRVIDDQEATHRNFPHYSLIDDQRITERGGKSAINREVLNIPPLSSRNFMVS